MKTLIVLLLLFAVPFSALAQSASVSEKSTNQYKDYRIEPPREIYALRMNELDDILGQYNMENGKTLTISNSGRRIFAKLEGLPKTQLVAAAPNRLVAKDGNMEVDFQQLSNGVVEGVTVMYVAMQN